MSDIITTLHPENDENTNLYPNIKKENIPNKSVDRTKLSDAVNNLLNSINELHPSGVDTSSHILAFTYNRGIWIGSDTGNWYYWNGTEYTLGGVYQSTAIADGSVTKIKIADGATIKPYGIIESEPSEPYNNFNTIPNNTIVTYSNITGVSNMPTNALGSLITYNYNQNGFSGAVQIYITSSNIMYYRINWGNNWKEWEEIDLSNYKKELSFLNYFKPVDTTLITYTDNKFITSGGNIATSNGFFYSSKIFLRKGETLYIKGVGYLTNVSMISEYISDTKYNPLVVSTSSNIEQYTYTAPKDMYVVYSGRVQYKDYIWYAQNNIDYIRNSNYVNFSLFSTFGVIGDSYASGNIFINDVSQGDIYRYSWCQILARKSGNTCTNFSKAGLHTRSWLTNQDYGLNKLLNSPKQDLYIIALGLNDAHTLGIDYLGTISDIHEDYHDNPDTFYGNYARIIENIQEYSNKSKIIISTMPTQNIAIRETFNNAIIEIANHYNLPLVDINMSYLCNYKFYYKNFDGGHPTAISYSTMANMYEDMINNCIVDNQTYFDDLSNL